MEAILTFINRHSQEQSRIMHQLRQLVLDAAPSVEESIKWKIPFYSYQGLLCYINPQSDGVCLGFCKGAQLSNEEGLLQGKGKEVRLLHIATTSPVPEAQIRRLLQEALLLNETMQGRRNYYV